MCHLAWHKPLLLLGNWICNGHLYSDTGRPHLQIEGLLSVLVFLCPGKMSAPMKLWEHFKIACISFTSAVLRLFFFFWQTLLDKQEKKRSKLNHKNMGKPYFFYKKILFILMCFCPMTHQWLKPLFYQKYPFLASVYHMNNWIIRHVPISWKSRYKLFFTFNPQSNGDALILNAIDQLTAIRAFIFQLKTAELQGGVHGMSLPQRSSLSKMAVWLECMCIGYHDNIFWSNLLWFSFGPFNLVMAGFGSEDTW